MGRSATSLWLGAAELVRLDDVPSRRRDGQTVVACSCRVRSPRTPSNGRTGLRTGALQFLGHGLHRASLSFPASYLSRRSRTMRRHAAGDASTACTWSSRETSTST